MATQHEHNAAESAELRTRLAQCSQPWLMRGTGLQGIFWLSAASASEFRCQLSEVSGVESEPTGKGFGAHTRTIQARHMLNTFPARV